MCRSLPCPRAFSGGRLHGQHSLFSIDPSTVPRDRPARGSAHGSIDSSMLAQSAAGQLARVRLAANSDELQQLLRSEIATPRSTRRLSTRRLRASAAARRVPSLAAEQKCSSVRLSERYWRQWAAGAPHEHCLCDSGSLPAPLRSPSRQVRVCRCLRACTWTDLSRVAAWRMELGLAVALATWSRSRSCGIS